MSLLFPILSLICGLIIASLSFDQQLKFLFSTMLARIFIPVVIVYNMVFYREGSLSLMGLSLVCAIVLFGVHFFISKNRLQALCFSYTNIGWLGFPVAIALFGPSVSAAMIALYIGGSLYGNIWAVSAVSTDAQPISSIIKKVMQSPPVITLAIALLFRSLGVQHVAEHDWMVWVDWVYRLAKWGMSFTGMCVLGIWLAHTQVRLQDLVDSTWIALLKMLCGAVLCTLIYMFLPLPPIEHALAVLFLLFCLPPAANIVALETYYQGTGTSAKYIAAGTIVSCIILCLYGAVLHLWVL